MSARGVKLPTLVLAVVCLLVLAPVAGVPTVGPERTVASGATPASDPLLLGDPTGDDAWIARVDADAAVADPGGGAEAGPVAAGTAARDRGERTTTRDVRAGRGGDVDGRSVAGATTPGARTGSTAAAVGVASDAGSHRDAARAAENGSGVTTESTSREAAEPEPREDGKNESAGDNRTASTSGGDGGPAADEATASGGNGSAVDAVGAAAVHDRGVVGEGVRIGVVGSGFDALPPAVADRVAASDRLASGAAGDHGAAVAEVASRTAPNASLYLIGVGDSPAPGTYEDAVAWLLDHEVDVIVDAGSYFPRSVEGRDRIAGAAASAADRGVVVVTSAGNYADNHWVGPGSDAGWVQFDSDSEVAFLADGDRIRGRVSLRLRWNSTNDHDLYLYRQLSGADAVVAQSTRRHDDNRTRRAEAIDVAVPRGRYYVAIRTAAGDADSGTVRLFSPRVPIQHATGAGALAPPAGADGVVPVAAGNASGHLTPYSSTGGDRGASVVAPGVARTAAAGRFEGTSAAAPYAGGVAALLVAENGNLTPGVVGQVLRNVSRERGRLDALHAWAAVSPNASLGVGETGIRVAVNGTVVNSTASNATVANASASNVTAPNASVGNASVSNASVGNATVSNATSRNGTSANATRRVANDTGSTPDPEAGAGGSRSATDAVAGQPPTELLLGFVRGSSGAEGRRVAGVARWGGGRPVFAPVVPN